MLKEMKRLHFHSWIHFMANKEWMIIPHKEPFRVRIDDVHVHVCTCVFYILVIQIFGSSGLNPRNPSRSNPCITCFKHIHNQIHVVDASCVYEFLLFLLRNQTLLYYITLASLIIIINIKRNYSCNSLNITFY